MRSFTVNTESMAQRGHAFFIGRAVFTLHVQAGVSAVQKTSRVIMATIFGRHCMDGFAAAPTATHCKSGGFHVAQRYNVAAIAIMETITIATTLAHLSSSFAPLFSRAKLTPSMPFHGFVRHACLFAAAVPVSSWRCIDHPF
jgi:hypothetical protein